MDDFVIVDAIAVAVVAVSAVRLGEVRVHVESTRKRVQVLQAALSCHYHTCTRTSEGANALLCIQLYVTSDPSPSCLLRLVETSR